MAYEGKKADGRFYLRVEGKYIEVSEQVYYGYMRSLWAEKKSNERTNRCYKEGRRCKGRCDECEYFRSGTVVSLDCMMEDSNFDIADTKRRSVEDTVILKMMIEALYEQIGRLEPEDRFLISALYLFDEPMTQEEIADELAIDQSTVLRRRDRILKTLHAALKDWED